jgi:hypothetical protein
VVADANAVGLQYVVIGGFSVIANGYLRATKDSDLLISDDPRALGAMVSFLDRVGATRLHDGKRLIQDDVREAEHLRVGSCHGIIDLLRGGLPPLDFATVAARALSIDVAGERAHVADLRSIVAFKRLADRPRDRNDLLELEALHGPLPVEPIPGLDD